VVPTTLYSIKSRRLFGVALALLCTASRGATAQQQEAAAPELSALSLEELMEVEVTSVSRRPERLLDAPAAVQVVTGEDIRRSGATTIADALRLATNLDVAQENSHEWVISARGFSSDVGNKLLVMMDGRTLYTPLFSGVFWDRQDYLLDDIDRIESISGPGGTLWGANAVNGVINITTKSAKDTQGLYVEAGGGVNPRGMIGGRYGAEITPGVFMRVYGKYADRDEEAFADNTGAHDNWEMGQGGFRVDVIPESNDTVTIQGDIYKNESSLVAGGRAEVWGGNVLGRWTRTFSEESNLSLQVYYDHTDLTLPTPPAIFAPAGVFGDRLDTYDIDFQHRFKAAEIHDVVWGFGYRYTRDRVTNSPGIAFFPANLNQSLYSGFVQDEIRLHEDVTLTLGTKVEHTPYTGFEYEPSARLLWTPDDRQSVWGAISRAVRTPSRIDREISQPAPGFLIVILEGGRNFKSETLIAYELGYRLQLNERLGGSISTFYNVYDDIRSTSTSPPGPPLNLPFPFFFENNLEGETYGYELNVNFQATDWWLLRASMRVLGEDIDVKRGRFDFNNALNETNDSKAQVSLRSSLQITQTVDFETRLRWVDKRTMNNAGVAAKVPPYYEMDARLGWDIEGPLELSLVGRNLLHKRHPEFGVPGATRVEIERAVYGKIIWRM